MVAHMNDAALRATCSQPESSITGRACAALCGGGAMPTSGQTQTTLVGEMRVDCDQDAFLAFVTVAGDGGAMSHTGPAHPASTVDASSEAAIRAGLAFIETSPVNA